jgi:hypothetical protein
MVSRTARSGAFLKEAALRPQRVRGWLTPKPDPDFETKCADIRATYRQAPALAEEDGRTVSIDEMSGVKALERAPLSLPMTPHRIERREYDI